MNVVVDTNVFVSRLLFGGVAGRILAAWTDGAFALVVSPPILEEYRRVRLELAKGRASMVEALDAFLALFTVHATMANPPLLEAPVCEDPTTTSSSPRHWPVTLGSWCRATSICSASRAGRGLGC